MTPVLQGATPDAEGTSFVVWADGRQTVQVVIEGHGAFWLTATGDGYFEARVAGIGPGARYRYCIDGGSLLPDPASRWQPEGSDGASVVQSGAYPWTDQAWPGIDRVDQVIYELHVGSFTAEGTWSAAIAHLADLRDLGIRTIQLMPVATFQGHFGWGYDTVLPYAPYAPYGPPDALKAFVDAAHALGLGVIHDVVYNHVGMGDHYRAYSDHYFTDSSSGEWGASFNFDGPRSRPVRDFIVQNAAYWIRDFHMDGLRLDATQALHDGSADHIIAEITRAVRTAANGRSTYVIAENQPQDRRLIDPPAAGGYGLDALVSDDFHHAARVAVTGHNDFYYRDYRGTPQELVSALKYGFLYQGQRSDMRDQPYGTDNLDTRPEQLVHFLENHDQIANSARGLRLSGLTAAARLRAITALLLLGPQTPCLFQGQEFGASTPFRYFSGVEGDNARAVIEGRRKSLSNFPSVLDPEMLDRLPDPTALETFASSRLDWSEAAKNGSQRTLHRDLLALRFTDKAFSARHRTRIDGAVIGEAAMLLRYFTADVAEQRLLLVNFGRDLDIGVLAEPLLAPPRGRKWRVYWSSEHPHYDGSGRREFDTDRFSTLPSDTAIVLASVAR